MNTPAYISEHDSPIKKKILVSALKLFVERGLCETTIRDIAADAGCTNPAIFKHFESKEALALHLFECCYLALFQAASYAAAGHTQFADKHRALIGAYAQALRTDCHAVLFAQENIRHFWPKISPAIRKHSILALIREMLEEGRRQHEVTSSVSAEMLTIAWAGAVQQFARMWYFGNLDRERSVAETELRTVLLRMVAV